MSDDRLADDLRVARTALGVSRQLDLQTVVDAIVRATLETGRAGGAFLYLYDGEQDTFHLRGSHVPPDDPRRKGILTLDLAELRGPGVSSATFIPAITDAPEVLRGLAGDQVLAVPLPGAGTLLGMLLLARGPDGFRSEDLERIGRLVPELVPALLNALVVERYKELIIKDDQTESYNRRYF